MYTVYEADKNCWVVGTGRPNGRNWRPVSDFTSQTEAEADAERRNERLNDPTGEIRIAKLEAQVAELQAQLQRLTNS